ncbi:MAG: hypothetical protein HGA84_02975 [Syntrophobacteraceae bacterium]|nr:hypothetical protein [Syntrophobacteraceae bacterium]
MVGPGVTEMATVVSESASARIRTKATQSTCPVPTTTSSPHVPGVFVRLLKHYGKYR